MEHTEQIQPTNSMKGLIEILLSTDEATANPDLHRKLKELAQKLGSGQLHLAVLGQMKRGKSTFINCLLGAEVLPTGVLPATAIITKIQHGPSVGATIIFSNGTNEKIIPLDTLADYITEVGNPGNGKQVECVSIAYPSEFLANGITLIDTPGIGSTHSHNTRTTEQYLGSVDAGIVVLSADLPITEAESLFVRKIKDEIPKLFFILNKTDTASSSEVETMEHYLRDELHRLGVAPPEVFRLSAKTGIIEKCSDNQNSASSGVHAFEKRLHTFFDHEKSGVLAQSVALDVLRIARTLRFSSAVGLRAATMEADQLEQKRADLEKMLQEAKIQKLDLRALIQQSLAELFKQLEEELKLQVAEAISIVRKNLRQFMENTHLTGRLLGTELEKFLMNQMELVFDRWLTQEDERVKTRMNLLSSRHNDHANVILNQVCTSAGNLFEIPAIHLGISCPLRIESLLRYRVEPVFYSLDNFLLILPGALLRPLISRRMHKKIPSLLDMNGGRIRFDYLERIHKSIAEFEKELLASITTLIDTLTAAIQMTPESAKQCSESITTFDSVMKDCALLLGEDLAASRKPC